MINAAMLRQVKLFSTLSEPELAQVAALGKERTFAQGEWCFRQGESADNLYVLRQGRVGLVFHLPPQEADRHITIETVEPNEIFGWSALVPPHQVTLSARCLQPCTAYVLPRDALYALFEKHERIGCHVMQKLAEVIGDRLRHVQQQLVLELSSAILAGHY